MKKLLSLTVSAVIAACSVFCVCATETPVADWVFKDDIICMTPDFADYLDKVILTDGSDDFRTVWGVELPGYESDLATGQKTTVGGREYTIAVLGDVLGNGKITPADARAALRAAARLEGLDKAALFAADMDFSGNVTPADARAILRQSARLDGATAIDYGSFKYSVISCEVPASMLEGDGLKSNVTLNDKVQTFIVSCVPLSSGNNEVMIIVKDEFRTAEQYESIVSSLKSDGFIFDSFILM